jgi:hypothetical protein
MRRILGLLRRKFMSFYTVKTMRYLNPHHPHHPPHEKTHIYIFLQFSGRKHPLFLLRQNRGMLTFFVQNAELPVVRKAENI